MSDYFWKLTLVEVTKAKVRLMETQLMCSMLIATHRTKLLVCVIVGKSSRIDREDKLRAVNKTLVY